MTEPRACKVRVSIAGRRGELVADSWSVVVWEPDVCACVWGKGERCDK